MAIKVNGITVIDNNRIAYVMGVDSINTTLSAINLTQVAPGVSAILQFPTALYTSAEVTLQIKQGSAFEITKFMVISDGTDVYLEEYGKIGVATNVVIGATVGGGYVTITGTSTTTLAVFKGHLTLIKV